MKFRIVDENNQENNIFLYSNENGMKHLNKVLSDNPLFSNLLTPEEILIKLSVEMSWQFSQNSYTGIASTKWAGKQLMIMPKEKQLFDETYEVWKDQLEKFVGKNNLFEVHMPQKELKIYEDFIKENKISDQGESFIEYVDKYRLRISLGEDLNINERNKKTNKI